MQLDLEQLDQAIQDVVTQTDFSGAVSIKADGRVVFAKAYGLAERSHSVPNTMETRFAIASGTKFLTALGIGRLIDAGQVSLSTRFRACVDIDFPNLAPEVTVGQLLTHTSGVYDYLDEEVVTDPGDFELPVPCYQLRHLRDYIPLLRQGPMKFRPGQRFSYSNSGYILLGLLIEALSGQTYAGFVQREILDRCGMRDSGFFAMNQLPARTATGYLDDGRSNIFHLPITGGSDGGVYATVGDIHKLWDAFFAGHIISPALRHTFLNAAVRGKGPYNFYGHGIWMYREPDLAPEYYITGSDAGVSFISRWTHDGEQMLTIISNTTHGAWPMRRAIDSFGG